MDGQPRRAGQEGLAILAMAAVNIIWGAAFPITKPALETIPPFTFALFRFLLALVVWLPLAGPAALAMLRGPDRWRLIGLGVSGFGLTQLAQAAALAVSPASDISLLAATSPIWVALLAWPWLGERLSGRRLLGLGLAGLGILLVVWPAEMASSSALPRIIGGAVFLIGQLGWAAYNILGKSLMARRAPLPATTAAALVGTVCLVPCAVGEWLLGATPQLSLIGVGAILYTGLLVTVVGFWVLFWALGRASVARVAVMMYLQPLAGVVLAWAALGEPISGLFLAGAGLVLAGVWLVTQYR